MSTWMSIGFDPDQMDPTAEPNTQSAISGARDDAAPRKHWIAGAIKHLVARHRTLGAPKGRLS
jgi:hypothetical protein